jgi:hypothetical protein
LVLRVVARRAVTIARRDSRGVPAVPGDVEDAPGFDRKEMIMTSVPNVQAADIDSAFAQNEPPPPTPQTGAAPTNADLDRLLSKEIRTPKIVNGVVTCQNMEQIRTLARHYISASMVPKGLEGRSLAETEGRVMIAIEFGTSIGLTPLQCMQSVMIVNGRPVLWGDAPMSLVTRHNDYGGFESKYAGEGDDFGCTFTLSRILRGKTQTTSQTFTVGDAKKAGLWGKGGPWSNYPKRMLMYRARSFCIRDTFPDALRGAGIAEEFDEFVGASPDDQTRDLQAKLDKI